MWLVHEEYKPLWGTVARKRPIHIDARVPDICILRMVYRLLNYADELEQCLENENYIPEGADLLCKTWRAWADDSW